MEMTTNKNDEMKITKDKQCILCPYKHEDSCLYNHDNCYSLSNIYYGKIIKWFPFNLIDKIKTKIEYNIYITKIWNEWKRNMGEII